jgi:hypothetical protein
MAPEVITESEVVDWQKSDVWSLAQLCIETCIRALPPPHAAGGGRDHVAPPAIILHALRTSPAGRFSEVVLF